MKLLWTLAAIVLVMGIALTLKLGGAFSPHSAPSVGSSPSSSSKTNLNLPNKIAFVSMRGNKNSANQYVYSIYTLHANAGQIPVGSTAGTAYKERPSWSADGTKVAMFNTVFSIDGKNTWTIPAKDSPQYGITDGHTFITDAHISWGPDSNSIVFHGSNGIYKSDFMGNNLVRLIDNGTSPSWSPDGSKITFCSDGLWLMEIDSAKKYRLVTEDVAAIWSPDGQKIAFESHSILYVINILDRKPIPIVTNLAWFGNLAWSPDSQNIIFSAKSYQNLSPEKIYVINTNSSNRRQLTNDYDNCSNPDWSPDGKLIVYEVNGGIYFMNADGSNQARLTYFGSGPKWSPK